MILARVLHFGEIWGLRERVVRKKSGKGANTAKAKIVDRGSACIAGERTCSKLQYDPYLISEACS